MAADASAGRVNHRGLLFDDADTAASGPSSGQSIDFFVGNSSSAVALRFRECRFRILRQFNRDARRCLVVHCGVDVAREWWDTGDVIVPIRAKLQIGDRILFAVTTEPPGGVVKHNPDTAPQKFRIVLTAPL